MISSDMSEYFSDKDRIKELEARNEILLKKLKTSQKLYSEQRIKWRKLHDLHNVTRADKATKLIAQICSGNINMTLDEVASRCCINLKYVKELLLKHQRANSLVRGNL